MIACHGPKCPSFMTHSLILCHCVMKVWHCRIRRGWRQRLLLLLVDILHVQVFFLGRSLQPCISSQQVMTFKCMPQKSPCPFVLKQDIYFNGESSNRPLLCRQVRRKMEEENKKARKVVKKEYNDTVRELVAFIRKRVGEDN